MKKKGFIIVGVIAVLIIGGIAAILVPDFRQEKALKAEIAKIETLMEDKTTNRTEINQTLGRTVTKGDYATVEKAAKQYISDNLAKSQALTALMDKKRLGTILTIDNFKEDGPAFVETKAYLSTTVTDMEKLKKEYVALLTEEKKMSYINSKNLDDYYVDFYRDELLNEDIGALSKKVEGTMDVTVDVLKEMQKLIDFLASNQKSWSIEDDTVLFDNDDLLNQYNTLLSEIEAKNQEKNEMIKNY